MLALCVGTGENLLPVILSIGACALVMLMHIWLPRRAALIGSSIMVVFSFPQLVSAIAADDDALAQQVVDLMSETQGHATFHACLGAWLGSQPTDRLGLRPKMAVAAVVLGANDVTMRVMARRGHGEPRAHGHFPAAVSARLARGPRHHSRP